MTIFSKKERYAKSASREIGTAKFELVDFWEVFGKRSNLYIQKNLGTKEVICFNELKRAFPGISSTILSGRLFVLEGEGPVAKKTYPQLPPEVEYHLALQVKELEFVLIELANWGARRKNHQGQKLSEITLTNSTVT